MPETANIKELSFPCTYFVLGSGWPIFVPLAVDELGGKGASGSSRAVNPKFHALSLNLGADDAGNRGVKEKLAAHLTREKTEQALPSKHLTERR